MTKLLRSSFPLIVFLICAALTVESSYASQSGNLEYWQVHNVGVKISEDFEVTVGQETRFGKSGSDPFLHNVDMGLVYKGFADWLDVSINFKKEYERDSSGKFRHENRPHLNITLKDKFLGMPASNRSRIEWRDHEQKKDVWRYRNKTTLKLPFELTKYNIQPYFAEEWFVNLGENNVNQNRVFAGFSGKITEKLTASIFYCWKTSKISGGWRDTNVIGTQFKFAF
jgi:hypothetical protein